MAVHITNQTEKDDLLKTFEQLDKDGDGVLSKEELIEGYMKFYGDRRKAEETVLKIWDDIDINKDGRINFTGIIMKYDFIL